MKKKPPLIFFLGLAIFFAFFGALFFPATRVTPFSPFFAILYQRTQTLKALWIASLCGLSLDLASSQTHFGAFAFTCCTTTLLLYRKKRHFFEEKPLSLSLFTILISITFSILYLLFLALFESIPPFSLAGLVIDVLGISLFDGIYAFFWFYLPMVVYSWVTTFHWKRWFYSLFLVHRNTQND